MKPWVLIDMSYIAYRAKYALNGLKFEDIPTGVIFGFFEQFKSICQDRLVQSNQVIFFFDSRKSYRRKVYPNYKKKRIEERTEEEKEQLQIMYEQIRILRTDILPRLGIQVHRQTGLESDDLMAKVSQCFSPKKERQAIIITSDKDLYQCISNAVHWYDYGRGVYYEPFLFQNTKYIEPSRWGEVKCITGCLSDTVEGIKGVGEKTAIEFLTNKINPSTKRYISITSSEGQEIIERNKELIILPHRKTKSINLKAPEYNMNAFISICKEYGLISFLEKDKRKEWRRFFQGELARKKGDL